MRKKSLVLAAVTAVASVGALAAPAAAAPGGSLCGSVNVTVNGQALIDESRCEVLGLPA
jgi:type 1 fimbria pilin